MRRRALLSGLLVGALAVLLRPFTVTPLLDAPDVPLEPDDGEGEGEEQSPPSLEPPPAEPPPLGPEEEEEEAPPTEPA